MSPHDDPTSLGAIMVSAGLITRDELDRILEKQIDASVYDVLGGIAVRSGLITQEQLKMALKLQAGLRSKSRSRRALAQAQVVELTARLIENAATKLKCRATELRRRRTGQEHPRITPTVFRRRKSQI